MGLLNKIRSLLPSYKWCGCPDTIGNANSYQFRVQARMVDGDSNLFQVREKRVCNDCGNEDIGVLVESECDYDPHSDLHDRKVAVESDGDADEMVDYGFMSQDEMARTLIEMRLSHSLEPELDDE